MNGKIACNFGSSVGSKFSSIGNPLYFPGNTLICILDRDSDIWQFTAHTQKELFELPVGKAMVALPDYSFHMTAIEGVCDQVRDEEHWTSLLPLDATLSKCNELFLNLLEHMPKFPVVNMRVDHLRVDSACSLALYPDTWSDDYALREWRDEVGRLLGLRFPSHDRYGFHIGLGYGLRRLDETEESSIAGFKERFDKASAEQRLIFQPPSPTFSMFDNMFSFGR